MGEKKASAKSILGGFVGEEVCCGKDDHLPIAQNAVYLRNFYADKLKYVHSPLFGYSKCEFSLILKVALMIESMNGEKKYDC